VEVQAEAVPTPTITFNGQSAVNVANNTTPIPVVVGQQIALTVTWSGGTPQTESWGVNDPQGNAISSVVGNYNGLAQSNQLTTIPLPASGPCRATAPCFTFYFVWAGSSGQTTQQVKYTWTINNAPPASALITFSIEGPVVTAQSLSVTFAPAQIVLDTSFSPPAYALELGYTNATYGATFTAAATLPTNVGGPPVGKGQYEYVQTLFGDQRTQLPYNSSYTPGAPQICNATPYPDGPGGNDGSLGLDAAFPYPWRAQNGTLQASLQNSLPLPYTGDSPTTGIPPTVGEKLRNFSATMYLLWDPALPANYLLSAPTPVKCVAAHTDRQPDGSNQSYPTECASIPVPLASLAWGLKACGINTLNPTGGTNLTSSGGSGGASNGTAWSMSCGIPNGGPSGAVPQTTVLQPNASNRYSYPQWGTVVRNLQVVDQTNAPCQ
jgi:hypothetical protein